ncbi:MAG: hypothetical protein HY828_18520 [Actinobacteria bacterium]|nr:hypothetical protein [Actinomycetota bacterium]
MLTPVAHILRTSVVASMLLVSVTACAEDTAAGSTTPAVTATAARAAASTAAASAVATTTVPATTTTEPRSITATGTWTIVADAAFGTVSLPSGYTWLGEAVVFDGDLTGTALYDIGVSPVGANGVVTSYADGTLRATMAGVGEGTLAWTEPEKDVTLPAAPGTTPAVGASGDFLGATGSFSWAYNPDGNSGTYEVRLVWGEVPTT